MIKKYSYGSRQSRENLAQSEGPKMTETMVIPRENSPETE
jgi:hypothetical protein